MKVDVWGPPSPVLSLEERIARSFSPPLFPIDLRDVPAEVSFHDVPRQPWAIGGATLTAHFVVHPGPTVGYRVDAAEASLAYVPDHEPSLTGIEGRSTDWISGAAIATDADLLLHDAQYSEEEYERPGRLGPFERRGRGRVQPVPSAPGACCSSITSLCTATTTLSRLEDENQVTLAREGMVVELP